MSPLKKLFFLIGNISQCISFYPFQQSISKVLTPGMFGKRISRGTQER